MFYFLCFHTPHNASSLWDLIHTSFWLTDWKWKGRALSRMPWLPEVERCPGWASLFACFFPGEKMRELGVGMGMASLWPSLCARLFSWPSSKVSACSSRPFSPESGCGEAPQGWANPGRAARGSPGGVGTSPVLQTARSLPEGSTAAFRGTVYCSPSGSSGSRWVVFG